MNKLDEVKNYLKIIYERSLAMDISAELDGIKFDFVGDDKVRFLGLTSNFEGNTLVINDVFDVLEYEYFEDFPKSISNIVWYRESGDLSVLDDIHYNYKLIVTKTHDLICYATNLGYHSVTDLTLNCCDIIRNNTFKDCMHLESVNLGYVHTIERQAFANCKNLRKVDLSKVCYIEDGGFLNTGIEYADLREMECINAFSFADCKNLKEITLSSKCAYVEDGAFEFSNNLKKVNFIGTQLEWLKLSNNIHFWRRKTGEYGNTYSRNKIYVKYIKN